MDNKQYLVCYNLDREVTQMGLYEIEECLSKNLGVYIQFVKIDEKGRAYVTDEKITRDEVMKELYG